MQCWIKRLGCPSKFEVPLSLSLLAKENQRMINWALVVRDKILVISRRTLAVVNRKCNKKPFVIMGERGGSRKILISKEKEI